MLQVTSANRSSLAPSPAETGVPIAWLDADVDRLKAWFDEQGQPAYRIGQVERWIFQRRAESFEQMTDLPLDLRHRLGEAFQVQSSRCVLRRQASDATEKLLLEMADGARIEAVLLRDGARRTVCLSSQVGCAMGCVFCASGLDGVSRSLRASEILEQLFHLQRLLPRDERISHIVMMGMGEPLANLDPVLMALSWASDAKRFGISARRITISTVGLPAAMRRLARQQPRFHLAVSLHAADDALRSQLVPVNRQTGLREILDAADEYFHASGRRLTFEYVLLGGINDRSSDAHRLAGLLRGREALVNLIPYNPVAGLPYRTPQSQQVEQFCQVLRRARLNVQVRQRKGDKISAACGQLRRVPAGDQLESDTPRGERG